MVLIQPKSAVNSLIGETARRQKLTMTKLEASLEIIASTNRLKTEMDSVKVNRLYESIARANKIINGD